MACRMNVYTRAKELGIQTEFVDGQGHPHVTDAVALKIILDALPERIPHRFLPDAVVVRSGETSRTELSPAASLPARWKIVAGVHVEGQNDAPEGIIVESQGAEHTIAWPADLPEGTYRLRVKDK